MECQDKIEGHANHRPGHYKENVHPLIYGLFSRCGSSWCGEASTQRFFSREVRDALAKYLRSLLVPCFPLPDRWLFPVSYSSHQISQQNQIIILFIMMPGPHQCHRTSSRSKNWAKVVFSPWSNLPSSPFPDPEPWSLLKIAQPINQSSLAIIHIIIHSLAEDLPVC